MDKMFYFNNYFRRVTLAIFLVCGLACGVAKAQSHDLYGRWVKRAAFGAGGSAGISRSVVDEHGNVYVTGSFIGTLNFSDDLCNPVTFTSQTLPANKGNAFLVKFDSTGRYKWIVRVTDESSTGGKNGTSPVVLDYANGKVLFGSSNNAIQSSAELPRIAKYTSSQGSTTILTSQSSPQDNSSGNYHMYTLQVIDAATGALENKIGDVGNGTNIFSTGTPDVYARFDGSGNIVILHFGYAQIYVPNPPLSPPANYSNVRRSLVAIYNMSNSTFTTTNKQYDGQQYPIGTQRSDGARIRRHITLPSGRQIVIHLAQDYSQMSGAGVPTFYIHRYANNFTHEAFKTITDKAIGIGNPPHLSSDDNSNIYMAVNYGDSKTWNTGTPVPNSNALHNSGNLFNGHSFSTTAQHNKVVVSKLNENLDVQWAIQIGTNNTSGSDQIYCNDIKTIGGFTYVVGRFRGTNVPFGGSYNLTSTARAASSIEDADHFDGFYAVYNNSNGACVYAVKIGGSLEDRNNTLFLADNAHKVLIGGSYKSPSLQVDPSGRLYPITSAGINSQAFVALYGPDVADEPATYTSSFGDAPESYGTAINYTCTCLSIGNLDPAKLQDTPSYSDKADSDSNDDGFAHMLTATGFTDHTNANHQLIGASGDFQIKVSVKNTSAEKANLRAWIDFNQNGDFDAGEESDQVLVNSGTSTTHTLTWTAVNAKIRNGKTYLRIRLTTDDIAASQSAGLFFNGEVEDYLLNFNLLEVSKTVTPTVAKIGAELEYKITVKNTAPFAQTLSEIIDPLPMHTTFVSANPTATQVSINLDGQTVNAVQWTSIAPLNAGASHDYTFKVNLTGAPQFTPPGDSIIVNVAYAVLNGDTISSSGLSCELAEMEVIVLDAVNDTVTTAAGTSKSINVLANDELQQCTNETVSVSISPAMAPQGGTAVVNAANNTVDYTPAANFTGVDSFRYILTGCAANPRRDSATVYIAVLKTEALNYVACQGASVTMTMTTIAGVNYSWYSVPTGGIVTVPNNASKTVVKDGSSTEVFWVEATYGAITFPRFRVELLLSDNCGTTNPVDCAADGSVIWKEDFDSYDDGLSPAGPVHSTVPLPGGTTIGYTFGQPGSAEGTYSLSKHGSEVGWTTTFATDDHTSPGDNSVGRLLLINGTTTPQQIYRKEIANICSDAPLYFSFWAGGKDAALQLSVYSSGDNSLLGVCEFSPLTGNLSAPIEWKLYGFSFKAPAGVSSIYFILRNKNTAAGDNNFAIDDIEVRLCAPPVVNAQVNGKLSDVICPGATVSLTVDPYNDNGVFATPLDMLKGYWIRSFTGDVNTPTDWTTIVGSTVTGTSPLTILPCTDMPPADDTVYYRFVISSAANVDNPNCRAASAVLPVIVHGQTPKYPDIRLQLCSGMSGQLKLSSYLDTTNVVAVQWDKISTSSPNFTGSTENSTGSLNIADFSLGTHIYKYDLTNPCGVGNGRVYVKYTSSPVVPSLLDTIVVCHSVPSAAHLQLNQMLGIEAGGSWSYNTNLNQFVSHIGSSSRFDGAYIFNAAAAWYAANNLSSHASYKITYNGDAQAAAFTFTYATGSQSCFNNKTRTLVLVITSKILPLH